MTYTPVLNLLRTTYGWPRGVSPAPDPVELALQTMTPEAVAETIDGHIWAWAENNQPPYGYPVPGRQGAYEWYRYRAFCDGVEYHALNTAIALGQVVEIEVPHERAARSVSEWLDNMAKGRDRHGYPAIHPDTEQGQARKAKAEQVPLEWLISGAGLIYQLACLSGMIPSSLTGFAVAYASTSPRLADVRGLDAQMWLENMIADDSRRPRPWLPGGMPNPKAAS